MDMAGDAVAGNWNANPTSRGLQKSWDIMVNYFQEPAMIDVNCEMFARKEIVPRVPAVQVFLTKPAGCPAHGSPHGR